MSFLEITALMCGIALVNAAAGASEANSHPHTIAPWDSRYFNGAQQKPNSFMLLENGERVGAWRTVGQRGNVAWVPGNYTHHGFNFVAQQPGHEATGIWINLAGISQSATGIVHEPVPTTVGTSYTLTFYVGNVYDPGGVYGTSSTVKIYIGKKLVGTFTNSDGQGSTTQNWKPFSLTFVADMPYTSIAFINGDLPGDLLCGLDNVELAPTTTATQGASK